MDKLFELNLDKTSAKAFDWVLSFISIGVGLWIDSTLWIIAGFLGCLAAYFRPLTKIQKMLSAIVTRRSTRS